MGVGDNDGVSGEDVITLELVVMNEELVVMNEEVAL